MKIDALDVYCVKNPLVKPWRTAYGEDSFICSILVKMTSGAYSAWSEASPLYAPTYSPEHATGVYHVITTFLAPLVLGKHFDCAEDLSAAMSIVKGNPFAKSAIEIAWWVLKSEMKQVPLHVLLGGTDQAVLTGADFGIQDSIDDLLELIDQAVKSGYPRVKLKVRRGWDWEMLRAVRAAFPSITCHIDCNSGYTLDDLPLFKKIDQLNLAMIEQPLFHTDILDHARLQAKIDTPVCLDESVSSVHAAYEAIELQACRYINIKPGRVGGLGNAMQINRLCAQAGIGCWVGGMLESAVGAGILIELATLPNMSYPHDLFPSSTFYQQDLSDNAICHSSPGKMMPAQVPGNAYKPDERILQERVETSCHLS